MKTDEEYEELETAVLEIGNTYIERIAQSATIEDELERAQNIAQLSYALVSEVAHEINSFWYE